jgi:hypothetical protein
LHPGIMLSLSIVTAYIPIDDVIYDDLLTTTSQPYYIIDIYNTLHDSTSQNLLGFE